MPRTANGPDMEAVVAMELICALLWPMFGSTCGGSGEAPEPPDLYARSANFGNALFSRWWFLCCSVAWEAIVADKTMSNTIDKLIWNSNCAVFVNSSLSTAPRTN